MTADQNPDSQLVQDIWRDFHWAFFVNTQGLILCLRRFADAIESGDHRAAEVELDTATALMRASGAAMQLAGSFGRVDYEQVVRPSMTPPNVRSEGFSGLMSWDHGVLVNLWRALRPVFADLPAVLQPAHARFARAYSDMAKGHIHVCAKFVGHAAQSLRYDDREALETLRRFKAGREALICPASLSGGLP